MQLKILCRKRSLAHILCSHAKNGVLKQRSANISRQHPGSSGAVRSLSGYLYRMLTADGKRDSGR